MKRLLSIAMAMAFIMALAFTTTTQAQDWTKEQKEVWSVVMKSWESWAKGDVESALEVFHEKYQGWSDEHPLPVGKEKIGKYFSMMQEMMKVEFLDLEPARITVVDDAAVVNYYFSFYATYTMGEKSKSEEVMGKNVEFYVKEGGEWLLLGDMTLHKSGGEEEDDD
jgi:hypothetical protein